MGIVKTIIFVTFVAVLNLNIGAEAGGRQRCSGLFSDLFVAKVKSSLTLAFLQSLGVKPRGVPEEFKRTPVLSRELDLLAQFSGWVRTESGWSGETQIENTKMVITIDPANGAMQLSLKDVSPPGMLGLPDNFFTPRLLQQLMKSLVVAKHETGRWNLDSIQVQSSDTLGLSVKFKSLDSEAFRLVKILSGPEPEIELLTLPFHDKITLRNWFRYSFTRGDTGPAIAPYDLIRVRVNLFLNQFFDKVRFEQQGEFRKRSFDEAIRELALNDGPELRNLLVSAGLENPEGPYDPRKTEVLAKFGLQESPFGQTHYYWLWYGHSVTLALRPPFSTGTASAVQNHWSDQKLGLPTIDLRKNVSGVLANGSGHVILIAGTGDFRQFLIIDNETWDRLHEIYEHGGD